MGIHVKHEFTNMVVRPREQRWYAFDAMAGRESVGDLIRRLRVGYELTGKELAGRTGIRAQRISDYETGKRSPTWKDACALGWFFKRDSLDFADPGKIGLNVPSSERPSTDAPFQFYERGAVQVTPWPIPVRGEGAGYSPHGCAWFGMDFLAKFDLDPSRCEVVEVRDPSMAPTFPPGSVCLVDLREKELANGGIYAIEPKRGLLIRRAAERSSRWLLTADNPSFSTLPWRPTMNVVGQVVWTARMVGIEPMDAGAAAT